MLHTSFPKMLLCLVVGLALIAAVVTVVPAQLLLLAAVLVLPIEAALVAYVAAPRQESKASVRRAY